jgi:hypothetical protein
MLGMPVEVNLSKPASVIVARAKEQDSLHREAPCIACGQIGRWVMRHRPLPLQRQRLHTRFKPAKTKILHKLAEILS